MKKWSDLSMAGKIFCIATSVVTVAGVEYGLFKDWSTAPAIEHTAAILITAGIAGFVGYFGIKSLTS